MNNEKGHPIDLFNSAGNGAAIRRVLDRLGPPVPKEMFEELQAICMVTAEVMAAERFRSMAQSLEWSANEMREKYEAVFVHRAGSAGQWRDGGF